MRTRSTPPGPQAATPASVEPADRPSEAPPAASVPDLEELVRRHEPGLRSFLLFLGCPRASLDDLLQDVFVAVLRSPFEERSDTSTGAYLRTVARHLLLKARRRDGRVRPLEDPLLDGARAEQVWSEEFDRDDEGAGYLEALRRCLEQLRGRARAALRLRYEEGLGRSAIAERLELGESGVKSVLVRARRRLRTCVEEKLAR